MRRWIAAWIAVALASLPILILRATSQELLRDTDTKVLLATLRERNAPFSWFLGDWPLQNHFYRPVSTLAFELDNRLYGNHGAGYGLTNALLCISCVMLLFWLLRELTDRPLIASAGAVLFALQHEGYQDVVLLPLTVAAAGIVVIGLIRHGFRVRMWLPAALVLVYSGFEVAGVGDFGEKTVSWLPGRTATVMTVFALAAMASYARYERLGTRLPSGPPSPLDLPATRTTETQAQAGQGSVAWAILSVVACGLALASYEQAVMLPAVMLAVAVTMRCTRFRVRWVWQAAYWALLIGYLVLRKELIPSGASHYQLQQLRYGPGVAISLFNYALPFWNGWVGFCAEIEGGWLVLLTAGPYAFLLSAASNLTSLYQSKRHWQWALAGYGMSLMAFLPMAWVKQFGHYHYWPMALRSLFTVCLLWTAYDLIVIAASPQGHSAPPRSDPAPGSLPHP